MIFQKFFQHWKNLQCIQNVFFFRKIFFFCSQFFYRSYQKIFRRMFHVDKFKQLHGIPCAFKRLASQCVCQKSRKTFFYDSVFKKRCKIFWNPGSFLPLFYVVFKLKVYFMLAARNAQNRFAVVFTA